MEKPSLAKEIGETRRVCTERSGPKGPHPWWKAGLRYFPYSLYLKDRFGERVQRVSVDGRFTCPNVDGTVAKGGCTFCDNRSFSPSRRLGLRGDISAQIDEGIRKVARRYGCRKFIAYFQPGTNTYAPADRLRELYEAALAQPQIVGLAVSTRPDCVEPPALDLLSDLAQRTYISVEYGLQTIHHRTLDWMNRGHDYDAFLDAVARSRGRGFEMSAHVILGLPGESSENMLDTARELARLDLDGVKIHNLYVVKNTVLAEQLSRGEVRLMERNEFVQTTVDFLELLPPRMRIERIGGEAPPDSFIAPTWSLDKARLLAAVREELDRRDSWQGKRYEKKS
jgi:radical SAM protein (TIGR01212 family)